MNEEEKNAIEYLKNRLYGNEDCKYIDVAQEDLRVFIKLIEKLQKENEELKNDYENLSNSVVVKNHYIKNSIPIQKVKDEIEKLNKKIDESIDNSKGGLDKVFIEEAGELLAQKRVLQELIKESEEK